jgi:hypothetical protein
MLKPDQVITKAPGPKAPAPRCALCGAPCVANDLCHERGWQVQECDCSGRLRRKADVARERLRG